MSGDSISLSRRRFLAATAGGVLALPTGVSASALIDSSPLPDDRPHIVGHRGFASKEPTNTVVGFERAIDIGADAVEADVRETKDGKLVLRHYPAIFTDNQNPMVIRETTYEELTEARIESEPIPTLSDLLELAVESDIHLYLEVKVTGITQAVLNRVAEYGLTDEVTIVSFETEALQPAVDSDVRTGILGSVPNPLLIENALELDVDMVLPHYTPHAMSEFYETARNQGLEAGYWALLDEANSVRDALEGGPDVAITNRPDIAIDLLNPQ